MLWDTLGRWVLYYIKAVNSILTVKLLDPELLNTKTPNPKPQNPLNPVP